jgi:hypothetical protein
MNFGEALQGLKAGEKAFRAGWNGKGMFIYLVKGTDVPSSRLRGEALDHVGYQGEGGDPVVTINSHIDMKAADGSIVVGWLASQTDMLAEDWSIYQNSGSTEDDE